MFHSIELDTILDALHAQRDDLEAQNDLLLDRGFPLLDPRRIAVQVKINKIEDLIMRIAVMGR